MSVMVRAGAGVVAEQLGQPDPEEGADPPAGV